MFSSLSISRLFTHIAIATAALTGMTVRAAPVDHAGRGLYHFASHSGCPFSGTSMSDCNRMALDTPDTHARIDTATHVIVFSSADNHQNNAVLGDVLLQGTGLDESGQRVPLTLQMLLRRSGTTWSRDIYAHVPVHGKFTDVRIDPYTVQVQDGNTTPFEHPGLASRLAHQFVEVSATDPLHPASDDITIAPGVGPLAKAIARAAFTSNATGNVSLNTMLASGTWAVQVDTLSNTVPVWAAQRELFLFSLEGQPLVRPLQARGFKKGDRLEFGARNGKGYLRVNGQEQPFAHATATGRAFLQESFMGLILAWHHRPATTNTANAENAAHSITPSHQTTSA